MEQQLIPLVQAIETHTARRAVFSLTTLRLALDEWRLDDSVIEAALTRMGFSQVVLVLNDANQLTVWLPKTSTLRELHRPHFLYGLFVNTFMFCTGTRTWK